MNRFMKDKILASVILILLLVATLNTASTSENAQDPLADKVDKLFSELNNSKSPGIAVLVVRDGNVLLRKGYGMANLEHQAPITPETVFDIASVSKQFCGMAISMLIEQEKISLQDDIHKYIPELNDFGHTITIDHLLHHMSGIRDWPGTLALAGWQMDDVISFDQILTMAFNQQGLNFKPGDEYLYSNTGYNLLAETVKRVTGKTFRQWTDENIFQPLGMKNTHFHDDHTEMVPNQAYSYHRGQGRKFSAITNSLMALGSSSLYTTIDDLTKWVINFDNPKVGGKAVLDRMLTRGVLNSGRKITYMFGLSMGMYRGLKTRSHGGSWAGFRTFLVHFPDQKCSVVTLLNHSSISSSKAAYDIADIYLADELKPLRKPARKRPDPKPVAVSGTILDEYVGIYKLGPAWYVTISRDGDSLKTQATAEAAVPMTAQSETRFMVKAYSAPIVFRRDKAGKVSHFLYQGMTCPKLPELLSPSPEQLAELTGEYESEELQTIYTIALEDGKLAAQHRRHGTISLTHAYKDDFRGGQWFMQSVEFLRNKTDKVTGFKVTQGRSRNQKFKKRK
ncbi:MAG: serine hydrolase [Deltaproteobacteria bacterium]|nr:serine hydrolase [Deltaproteobacteria bacterium]